MNRTTGSVRWMPGALLLLGGAIAGSSACGQEAVVQEAAQVAPALAPKPPPPPVPAAGTTTGAVDRPAGAPARAGGRRGPLDWRLQIVAPEPLDDLLQTYLDVARYSAQATALAKARAEKAGKDEKNEKNDDQDDEARDGPAQARDQGAAGSPDAREDQPPQEAPVGLISRSELRRLVAATPEQARALLEAEGYFAAEIKVSLVDDSPGVPAQVRVDVVPGPKATVSQLQMIFEGELDTRLGQGDAQAQALAARLEREWDMAPGQPFRQARWSSSKNGALATLRSEGYPTATWSGTAATVDAQAHTTRLYVVADSGPLFLYGPLVIEGLQRQPASAIENVAGFKAGEPYREDELLDFQERLQKLNLFDSVFVSLVDDPAQAKAAPVSVKVREQKLQQATVGVGVSSDTGARISLEHLHRLPLGQPWQAATKLRLGRKESLGQLDLTSHPRPGRKRWLTSALASRELDTDDAVTESRRLRAGVLDEGERLERTSYVEYQSAEVTSPQGLLLSDASALTATQQYLWRDLDSPVLPTRGFTANVQGSAGRTFSTLEEAGWFGRVYGRLTWYRPLPGGWYASVRGEAGHVAAADDVGVPETLLFRAGGDESVRGYGYRTLGVEQAGVTLGGRALLTTSVEVARPLLSRFPSLWGAVFLDAGDAARDWSSLRLKPGYGVGVRLRSPVGPLRLDLAYGQEVREFRVHFSVGITL